MEEFSKILKHYTVFTIIVIMLMTFICASFIAGFKVEFNITGEEQPRISFEKNFGFDKDNI
ncbi:MAG: hypothetical protein IKC01_06305 [Clostridia bacterium]|nr:hypothetical protein [Clostridia bacterium]